MRKYYTIFVIVDLEPKYFYMWVNFVDLIFKHFNMEPKNLDFLENTYKEIEILVKVLLKICNYLNILMLYLGIITYFIFIYIQKIRTPIHKTYVIVRFIVVFSRFLIFLSIFIFYIRYWYNTEEEE